MLPVRISCMLVGNENLDVTVVCNNNILKLFLLLTTSWNQEEKSCVTNLLQKLRLLLPLQSCSSFTESSNQINSFR